MPPPLSQLALIIQLCIRDVARTPATILFISEHGGPKALHVVTRDGIDTLHLTQEEILQHSLIELLWMLVDRFASQREDRAGLKADRLRRSIVTKVVEEVLEVLCRRLRSFFALEYALW